MRRILQVIKMLLICILALPAFTVALPVRSTAGDSTCGYSACHATKPGYINVHIIPHSHDDVGWLKTVDQYYYGLKQDVQVAKVKDIIDTALDELKKNSDRRFIYVETAFLWKWWLQNDEDRRQLMTDLINSGQLEIIGGAWSMNDEAASNYQSIIDQFTFALRKLNDTFGACGRPHVGWQIDPFGHSREMASIFAQLGYDGVFFARSDYQDRQRRYQTRNSEMIWQGSANLGTSSRLFAATFNNSYYPPSGFCFDSNCAQLPIIDDPQNPLYNVDTKVSEFIAYIQEQAFYMKTDHVLVTMGGDFHYQEAASWFVSLDKLIKYVNEQQAQGSTLHVLYSTPSCYLKAVNDANEVWELKEDDFFPYASDSHEYWTGYFTSRPTSKYFERKGNNFLQICKQLYALADVEDTYSEDLQKLQEIMGVYQHHDAITGTEKQNVCDDYNLMLYDGFQHCGKIIDRALNKISARGDSTLSFSSCLLSNISQCDISETSLNFVVTVYNPLSQATSYYVRIPVQDGTYSVKDGNGNEQIIQLVPIPDAIYKVPGRDSNATQEIVFQATDVPALGYRSYYVSSTRQERSYLNTVSENATSIGNNYLQVILHETQGTVKSVIINGTELPLSQNFYYYEGWAGTNAGTDDRSSGAYIFRPIGSEATVVSGIATVKIYKGDLVEEVHQTLSDWISQVIRVYKTEKHIEFEWLVGPVPTEDMKGKEIISRFNTNLVNNETFYTDSNGREMIKRRVNYRSTWDYVVEEPVSGNYYPITSKIVIKDENKGLEMAILNDRAQGGSSLRNGEIELMVHRRLLRDDGMGVAEALQEEAFGKGLVARGKHWLLVGNITRSDGCSLACQERKVAEKKLLSPWVLLSNADNTPFTEWTNSHETQFSGLRQELPQNVKILTLEPWKDTSLLLRLEHMLEKEEDTNLSQPATINLEALFAPFSISSIRETTLGGNQWLEDNTRLIWIDEEGTASTTRQSKGDIPNVTLEPMEIRTFVIEIDRQKASHTQL
ncbi:lysosomal alpha-mannosidase-like [Schistocerca gregaria]|uniref:lysosomal alpha-mannosidase-like n=1 Tax=Schistocerca gregaria TaxID=7010 RepID=UPI00211E8E25|nr:lysosomal alpha-mannosidase-like [Schistocerca gregaria]